MANRLLPNVYSSLNDLSNLPEGQTSLTVGIVQRASKGPVNVPTLVTSPQNYLDTFMFGGIPSISDDPTTWSILKILAKTNTLYVSRAANNPVYGGVVFRTSTQYGYLVNAVKDTKKITFTGKNTISTNEKIVVPGLGVFTVASSTPTTSTTTVTVQEDIFADITSQYAITNITNKVITISGSVEDINAGSIIAVVATGVAEDTLWTVENVTENGGNTKISIVEAIPDATGGNIYTYLNKVSNSPIMPLAEGLANPETYEFKEGELFLITGSTPGGWNNSIEFECQSSLDTPDMIYTEGNKIGDDKYCTFNTVNLVVRNADTKEVLSEYLFSRDTSAKTVDGISLYIENVIKDDNNIMVVNNEEADASSLPLSTDGGYIAGNGGNDGGDVTPEDMVAALTPFSDKVINVSVLTNGCSNEAESDVFQKALIEIAENRKDCFIFLNNRRQDETATLNSQKAQNIVEYKKNELASVSFYGSMYCPHGKTTDIYNSRQVKIGSAEVAVAGWLDVINNLNYPNAYAGPKNGLVTGMTYDWKIGDTSGEATLLNNASVNYVAFDPQVGRYYMQCQNTLQIANSAMRNIGAVLNILDIKEHLITLLKEFIQLPITDTLRSNIVDTCVNYLDPMNGSRFSNYSFADMTSDVDVANNTLRFLLTIAPTSYAQNIFLVMNIVNATYDFSIVQSL